MAVGYRTTVTPATPLSFLLEERHWTKLSISIFESGCQGTDATAAVLEKKSVIATYNKGLRTFEALQ